MGRGVVVVVTYQSVCGSVMLKKTIVPRSFWKNDFFFESLIRNVEKRNFRSFDIGTHQSRGALA